MLGRSANGIFWMFRYLERAENTARLLDAGFRMALTRGASVSTEEWRSVLITMGIDRKFKAAGGEYSGAAVCNFILRDKDNSASVLHMIEEATPMRAWSAPRSRVRCGRLPTKRG